MRGGQTLIFFRFGGRGEGGLGEEGGRAGREGGMAPLGRRRWSGNMCWVE